MSQLVRLEGKHTAQTAHCAVVILWFGSEEEYDSGNGHWSHSGPIKIKRLLLLAVQLLWKHWRSSARIRKLRLSVHCASNIMISRNIGCTLHSIIHDNYDQKVLFLIFAIKCCNTEKFTKIGSCLKSMKWCRRWKSIKRNHETCRTDQESKTARSKKRCFLFELRLFLSKSQKEEGISRPIGVF